jgi:hypothetical protein
VAVTVSHCTIDALISVVAVPVPPLRAVVVFFLLFRLLLLFWVDNRNPLRNPDILVVAVSCVAEHILGVSARPIRTDVRCCCRLHGDKALVLISNLESNRTGPATGTRTCRGFIAWYYYWSTPYNGRKSESCHRFKRSRRHSTRSTIVPASLSFHFR